MEHKIDNNDLIISNIENDDKKLLELKKIIFDSNLNNIIFNLSKSDNIDSSTVAAFLSVIKFTRDSNKKFEIIFLNPPKTIETKLGYVGLLDFGIVKRDL